jgi:UDP-N-acetyl-2-amino-2-deoxyglucuronate dehydrogenase
MKYALIGCGRISRNHIKAAKNNALEIVAICDLETSKLDQIKKEQELNDNLKLFNDYLEMIRSIDLDIVAIATDSGSHAKIAKDCIRMGINVLIEKPMAMNVQDAEEIIKLGNEYGVKIAVCHQNRFNKSIEKLRDSVNNGQLGVIHYGTANVRWFRDKNYYSAASWRGTVEQDGGVLMNQAIHNIDLLLWFLGGDVIEVKSFTSNFIHPYIETEDFGAAIIKMSNGTFGIIEATSTTYPKNYEETLHIFASKATIKIGGYSVNRIDEWIVDGIENTEQIKKEFSEEPENIYGNGHIPLYQDLINSIKDNRKPFVSGEEGIRALRLIEEVYNQNRENL